MDRELFIKELINNRFDIYKTLETLNYDLFSFFQRLRDDEALIEEMQSYEKVVKLVNRFVLYNKSLSDKPDFNSQKLMEEKIFKEINVLDVNNNTAIMPVFDEEGRVSFEPMDI